MNKIKTGAFIPFPIVPIALVGTNIKNEPNYATIGFTNGVNSNPAIVYISINRNHYTSEGIIENKTFSINFPSAEYVVETDFCGLVSERKTSKSKMFTSFYGELGTAPMIQEFPITCECRFIDKVVEFAMDRVYFGEVVQVYINEEYVSDDKGIDSRKMKPLCFLGLENRYCEVGKELGQGWSSGKEYRVN